MKKTVIIIIVVIICTLITIGALVMNTIRPKNTSKELIMKVTEDVANFSTSMVEYINGVSSIIRNDFEKISTTDDNSAIDLRKSSDFKDLKERVDQSCDEIINYDNYGLSKEANEYLECAKKVAVEAKQYYDSLNREITYDEFLNLNEKLHSNMSNYTEELKEASSKITSEYYNETTDSNMTLEEFE